MRDILLITNVAAGSNEEARLDAAVSVLRRSCDVEVVATCDQADLDAALRGRTGRDVVVAGGDGTLHALVATLHACEELSQLTVGLVPLGTGNDFARGALIPLDPAKAAEVIVSGRTSPVDIFVDSDGDVVVNAVHVGVGAEAAREAAPWKQRLRPLGLGRLGYAVGAVIAGFTTRGHRLRVVADDAVLAQGRRRVLQVAVGNGSRVGGGAELTPDADPSDGLAEVLVSFAVKPWDRLLYGVRLKRGTHDERHDVHVTRARRVTVSVRRFWFNADGEVNGPARSRTWTVQPAAFTMRLPTAEQARESFPAPRIGAGKSHDEPVVAPFTT